MAILKRNAESVEQIRRRVGRLDGSYQHVTDIPPVERQRMITEYVTDYLASLSPDERANLDAKIFATLADQAASNAAYRGDAILAHRATMEDIIISEAVSEVRKYLARAPEPLPDPAPWWARYRLNIK